MLFQRHFLSLATERLALLHTDAPNLTWPMDLPWMHWGAAVGLSA